MKLVASTAIALAGLLSVGSVMGQGKTAAPSKVGVAGIDAKTVNDALKGSDPGAIENALVSVRMAGKEKGGRAATGAIVARLKAGLPKELLKKALATLGDLEDPAGLEGCEIYLAHRDPEVRLEAVRCLGGIKGASAVKGLRVALADYDVRVRATAASLLGEAKADGAVPDLVVALEKGVNEAAVSIGMLCDAKSCDELTSRLKTKPLDVVFSGLQQVLVRPLPDDYRKKVVTQVRELSSGKAREFLESVRKTWPPNGSKGVAEAIDKAIKDLEGAK
jgi:hypothetical protein